MDAADALCVSRVHDAVPGKRKKIVSYVYDSGGGVGKRTVRYVDEPAEVAEEPEESGSPTQDKGEAAGSQRDNVSPGAEVEVVPPGSAPVEHIDEPAGATEPAAPVQLSLLNGVKAIASGAMQALGVTAGAPESTDLAEVVSGDLPGAEVSNAAANRPQASAAPPLKFSCLVQMGFVPALARILAVARVRLQDLAHDAPRDLCGAAGTRAECYGPHTPCVVGEAVSRAAESRPSLLLAVRPSLVPVLRGARPRAPPLQRAKKPATREEAS